MNKLLRLGAIFLLLCLTLFSLTNDLQLSFPVRVIKVAQNSEELNANDIKLVINGSPRKVINLIRRERSLSGEPDLGRHFILSFHNIKGSTPIENIVSYFVSEILDPKDSLLLLSPLKAYRIPVTQDKQKIITDVCGILMKDGTLHEKNRISAEKKLESDLHRLNTIASTQPVDFFPEGTRNPEQALTQTTNLTTNYKAIYQILLNFPQSFTLFKNQYLLPDIVRHQQIKGLLEKKHGDNWWIHFQHRDDFQIIQKARSAGQKLNGYIATHESGSLARNMEKSLADFEKELLISASFPQADILDTLLGKNICFNVVHWGSLKSDESDTSFNETSDLEAVMCRIAECSGGKNVVASDPEQALKKIKSHADTYYDLTFALDGKIAETNIQVLANRPDLELSYKQNFSSEEMQEWVHINKEKKVEIRGISMSKKTIDFEIDSFEKDREKRFGLLKVRISLFDEQNRNAYKSENTLRASKDNVKISVPFSREYKGRFRLVIEIFDLLANTSATSEQFIELNSE